LGGRGGGPREVKKVDGLARGVHLRGSEGGVLNIRDNHWHWVGLLTKSVLSSSKDDLRDWFGAGSDIGIWGGSRKDEIDYHITEGEELGPSIKGETEKTGGLEKCSRDACTCV